MNPLIYDLNPYLLPKLFNYTTPHQKLSRLNQVDFTFNLSVFEKSAWDSTRIIRFKRLKDNSYYDDRTQQPKHPRHQLCIGFSQSQEPPINELQTVSRCITNLKSVAFAGRVFRKIDQVPDTTRKFILAIVNKNIIRLRLIDTEFRSLSNIANEELNEFYIPLVEILLRQPKIVVNHVTEQKLSSDWFKLLWPVSINELTVQFSSSENPTDWSELTYPKIVHELIIKVHNEEITPRHLTDLINRLKPDSLKSLHLFFIHSGFASFLDEVAGQIIDKQLSSLRELKVERYSGFEFESINQNIIKRMLCQCPFLLVLSMKCFRVASLDDLVERAADLWEHTTRLNNKKQAFEFTVSSSFELNGYPSLMPVAHSKLQQRLASTEHNEQITVEYIGDHELESGASCERIMIKQSGVELVMNMIQ